MLYALENLLAALGKALPDDVKSTLGAPTSTPTAKGKGAVVTTLRTGPARGFHGYRGAVLAPK